MVKSYLTVTALTKYIKQKIDLDPHLTDVWLKGEISNFNHHRRGHMYMTIKDENARIQAAMFAGHNRFLKFTPENGMNVLLRGNVSVYEPYGQYQFYIKQMEPDGVGSLHLAFEQLKEKLKKKGYFEQSIKKPIPKYPKHIGIVTSPTGAAVKDIITTIKRRYPIVKLTVIPVQVQGEEAVQSICKGIERANERGDFDLLIVGRGGGSIEDLWAFNEEIVAQAIYKSNIPIISAVGHETDTTITDFVSDLRAPTPTAAAELAVPSQVELNEKIINLNQQLTRLMSYIFNEKQTELNQIQRSYGLRTPRRFVEQKEQQLDYLQEKLIRSMTTMINELQYKYNNLNVRFDQFNPKNQIEQAYDIVEHLKNEKQRLMKQIYDKKVEKFIKNVDKLTLMNPLEIMKRGFTVVYSDENELIKSTEKIKKNDNIKLNFVDGTVLCQVEKVRRHSRE